MVRSVWHTMKADEHGSPDNDVISSAAGWWTILHVLVVLPPLLAVVRIGTLAQLL